MAGVGMFTIGELARRTGLPVKTIRFYSDEGLLPPTDRTPAGYRLYDGKALARLELVRTLRELGIGLAEVASVLTREATVSQLAAAHVEALDERIRMLRLRRSVLRAVVKRGSEPEELKLMNRLASMSDDERKRLLDEFWDEVSAGLDVDEEFYAYMRSAKPELPDDPSPEQLEAWIELAELVQDEDFRRLIRKLGESHEQARAQGRDMSPDTWRANWESWHERVRAAMDAGASPESPEAKALADEIARASAPPDRDPADPEFRRELADQFTEGGDPRAARYWQLLATVNGWPPVPSQQDGVQWLIQALRA